MIKLFNRKQANKAAVKRWRDAITAQARLPEPFLKGWVTDTVYGRFNMVALVAALAMRRLRDFGQEGRTLSQAISEMLFSDFDHALRENGVGDSSIARRIRKMGEEFFGLVKAIDEALGATPAKPALIAVLQRNVQPDEADATALAAYMLDLNVDIEDLSEGEVQAGPERLSKSSELR
ncbi:MAG: ubiquinol-cytochrome C chaperone family protein [Pseudomonadota bacterium]